MSKNKKKQYIDRCLAAGVRTLPDKCPTCGYVIDAATSLVVGEVPEEGDYSICVKCGAVNVFDKYIKLRPPTFAEMKKYIAGLPDYQQRIREKMHEELSSEYLGMKRDPNTKYN